MVDALTFAAMTHDSGMLVLPREILLKPGHITDDEQMIIQTHTAIGEQLLLSMGRKHPELSSLTDIAAEVALAHHERWDGSGYPNQLAGNDIPLSARFIGLLSVYEAMRTRKPFRPALSHPAAVQRIAGLAGKQFDPNLCAAFARCASALARVSDRAAN
jgi:HD-GYP domain-containing protein (c-di-GMP phosphodiesterase class II)